MNIKQKILYKIQALINKSNLNNDVAYKYAADQYYDMTSMLNTMSNLLPRDNPLKEFILHDLRKIAESNVIYDARNRYVGRYDPKANHILETEYKISQLRLLHSKICHLYNCNRRVLEILCR